MNPGEAYSPHGLFLAYQVPVSLAADPRLNWFAKVLFGVLRWHAGKQDRCFVRRDTLAKELGTSIDTVDRGLLALVSAKLIQPKRRGLGRENEYTFLWEPAVLSGSLKADTESAQLPTTESADLPTLESAELRLKSPQFCGGESADLPTPLKEEEKSKRRTPREEKLSSAKRADGMPEQASWFAEFWNLYPKKDAKQAAWRAFKAKVRTPDTWEQIRAALAWQVPKLLEQEPKYRKAPATWINGGCWTNEPDVPAQGVLVPKPSFDRFAAQAQQRDAIFRELMAERMSR